MRHISEKSLCNFVQRAAQRFCSNMFRLNQVFLPKTLCSNIPNSGRGYLKSGLVLSDLHELIFGASVRARFPFDSATFSKRLCSLWTKFLVHFLLSPFKVIHELLSAFAHSSRCFYFLRRIFCPSLEGEEFHQTFLSLFSCAGRCCCIICAIFVFIEPLHHGVVQRFLFLFIFDACP